MDFVISLYSFRDAFGKPIIKELAVLGVDKQYIGHWIVAPHSDFTELPVNIQEYNNWMSSTVIGIEWFDGDILLQQLHSILRSISRSARTLYAVDAENAKLIESIVARNVVDLSAKGFSASSLNTRDTFCYHHGAIQKENNFLCALTVGENIKRWILQKNLRSKPQQTAPTKNLELLENNSYNNKKRKNGHYTNTESVEEIADSIIRGFSSG